MDPFIVEPPNEVYRNGTWSTTSAKEAAHIMYEATDIEGVIEKVPAKLRGVYWFRGDATGEKLVSLQYGRWFEKEQIFVQPISPFMWAFADDVPNRTFPFDGANWTLNLPGSAFSYSFSECPQNAEYCTPGADNLSNGLVQSHLNGDMATVYPNGVPPPFDKITGTFTFEDLEGSAPGSLYKRPCYWGYGRCKFVEVGTYTLTKVIDAEGQPLEPYHSEFLEYMGDTKVYMWTGFTDEASMQKASAFYEDMLN